MVNTANGGTVYQHIRNAELFLLYAQALILHYKFLICFFENGIKIWDSAGCKLGKMCSMYVKRTIIDFHGDF